MKFTGQIPGLLAFSGIEAECPVSLLQKVDPTADENTVRCWVLVQGGENQAMWAEVFLTISGYFSSIRAFAPNPDDIQIRFRANKGDPGLVLEQDITALTLEESFSGEDSRASTAVTEEQPTIPSYSSPQASNLNDPITGTAVLDLEDPFLVVFYAKKLQSEDSKNICVSKSGLEAYVACALNAGKDIFNLKVAPNVICIDEKTRSFSLTPTVWAESLLPHSRTFTQLFLKANEIALQRRQQLATLEGDGNLWNRVQFWLSDMLSFQENPVQRLTYSDEKRIVDDNPPFLTLFYFEAAEARNLGNFIMSNGTMIQDNLHNLAQRLSLERDSPHTIGVILCSAFNIEARFQLDRLFQRRKARWLKERRQELAWVEH
jgi:hypothetical protein